MERDASPSEVPTAESSLISTSSSANATISSSSVDAGAQGACGVEKDAVNKGAPSSGVVGGEVGSAAWREALPALDRWGFELAAGGDGGSPGVREEQVRLENSRLAKWHKMLSIASGELPPQQTLPAGTRRLLAKRVPKGVPDPLRGTVWCALSGAQALMDERPGAYAALKRRAAAEGSLPEAVAAQIDNDLQRTYPEHFLWREHGAGGQPVGVQMLRSVLRSYALLDTEVRYCQAMNFIAGALLMYCREEAAFWLLVQLMFHANLRALFKEGLPLLQASLQQLRELMGTHLPRLAAHLEASGVDVSLFATQWFMTLGLDCLPFDASVRLIDLVCHEGSLRPLFRFALGVLSSQERALLQLHDMEQLMLKLRNLAAAMEDTPRFFKRHVAPQRPKLPQGFGQEGKQEPPRTPSAGRVFT